jgi:hypothetical protein
MSKPLSLSKIMQRFQTSWQELPDHRQPSNNTRYEIADAAKAAFSVFFMQSPSFLAHQRDVHQRKGRDNVATLFGAEKIPSDVQIRNLLDPISPDQFHSDFDWVIDELDQSGHLTSFQTYAGTYAIAFDGVVFHSSEKIHCQQCSQRQDRSGVTHYYHSAIIPVMVKPNSPHVLSLPPECIVPQDGHEKQDCERAAVKRWLAHHQPRYQPKAITYLGDDLYANQPLCQLIEQTYEQFFLFVCKPDSHTTLYEWLAALEKAGGLEAKQVRHWNGKHGEIWSYRFVNGVPLRAGEDALMVNWFELTIVYEETGKVLYHNAWVTNHTLSSRNVAQLAQLGRARWKVENENINVLKTKGYNLNHNFGHGDRHLANVFFTLNLLAFLLHTAQHLVNEAYRLLRETLSVRRTFFNDLKALTRYMVFDSWESLFAFMIDGLELDIPPP